MRTPSIVLTESMRDMTTNSVISYVNEKGHSAMFLAMQRMSADIRSRFKKGDTKALGEAKMMIEIALALTEYKDTAMMIEIASSKPIVLASTENYLSIVRQFGSFAGKCISSSKNNETDSDKLRILSNAKELMNFYNKVVYNNGAPRM